MLAKYWKKIGLVILIIACVINIMSKSVGNISFYDQLKNAANYILNNQQKEGVNK